MIYISKKKSTVVANQEVIFSLGFTNNGTSVVPVDSTGTAGAFTVAGGASISTTVTRPGQDGSLRMVGSSGGLRFTLSKSLNIRTDSYTISGWLYPSTNTFNNLLGVFGADVFYPLQYYGSFGTWNCGDAIVNVITYTETPTLNTWVNMTLSHDVTTNIFRMFKNGTVVATSAARPDFRNYTASSWEIGARTGQSLNGNGYYGPMTITKGFAQTSNFTPT
jgi:hypothetical protein